MTWKCEISKVKFERGVMFFFFFSGQMDLSLIKEMSERQSVGKTKGSINEKTKSFFSGK